MLLETPRLIIRNHIKADWNDLLDYLKLPEIYQFEPGKPVDETGAKKLVDIRSQGDVFLAVVEKKSQKMIGHLYFNRIDPKKVMTWELGYIFNPCFQNLGFCTEASKAIAKYGFEKLSMHKLVAYTNPNNVASWRVLEKIGMRQEGLLRQNEYFRLNAYGAPDWFDCKAYGLLKYDLS